MSQEIKQPLAYTVKKQIIVSVLLIFVIVAITGCSSQTANEPTEIQTKTAQTQTTQDQTGKEKGSRNPSVKAAMDIMMLQNNPDLVLTSAQCTAISPILQELIDTSDPSDEFLQEKAAAITELFNEAQKTFLTQKPQENKEPTNGPPPDQTRKDGQKPPGNGTPPNNSTPPDGVNTSADNNSSMQDNGNRVGSMEPTDIYKQALATLK